jgi:hypothetical protein
MRREDSHLTDQWLLLDLEGELTARDQAAVRAHLDACWECRGRRRAIEDAIGEYMRLHQRAFEEKLPSADGPRALLRARLAHFSAAEPRNGWSILPRRRDYPLVAAFCALAVAGLFVAHFLAVRWSAGRQPAAAFSMPDSRLTPGAAVLVSKQEVCSEPNVKNKAVSPTLQRQVFEEYGIANAAPQAYEVDYLVTPALGGADDLRNLWPHAYGAVWNARVKDDLEDRLRDLVCSGSLDLDEAQHEIAGNWIAAYKKYFHTEQPLEMR